LNEECEEIFDAEIPKKRKIYARCPVCQGASIKKSALAIINNLITSLKHKRN
jgi:cytochrome c-type biogenesis protein CcmH/NrfF